jgi:hypothetical protein
MIIRIASDRSLGIEDAMNFKKFKVACDVPATQLADIADANVPAVRFDDVTTAWVSIAALESWTGLSADRAWQDGLAAMIKAATPHGWIDAEKRAIKAHVEWAA